jgi:GNAT superfamily N-acetyltransferase
MHTPDTIIVRPATADDIPRLAELRYEFRRVLATPDETAAEFIPRCEQWMRKRLGDGQWHCWAAERDGVVIGNVWLSVIEKMPNPIIEPEENAYITSFFVLDEARGQGIGSRLLDRALSWCQDRGVYVAILWPTPLSRPLYERHGFSANGEVMQRTIAQ